MKKEAKIAQTAAQHQALVAKIIEKIATKSYLVKDIANHLEYGLDFIQDKYSDGNFFYKNAIIEEEQKNIMMLLMPQLFIQIIV